MARRKGRKTVIFTCSIRWLSLNTLSISIGIWSSYCKWKRYPAHLNTFFFFFLLKKIEEIQGDWLFNCRDSIEHCLGWHLVNWKQICLFIAAENYTCFISLSGFALSTSPLCCFCRWQAETSKYFTAVWKPLNTCQGLYSMPYDSYILQNTFS